MTVMAAGIGLDPLLWAQGAGADTMRRLAVPMIGGLATSFLMELLIYSIIFYYVAKNIGLRRLNHAVNRTRSSVESTTSGNGQSLCV